jgi:pilus assembly protein Flp/PilA
MRDERSKEQTMKSVFTRFLKDESGATAIEYGLLAALISVVIIGTVKVAGTNLSAKFQTIANNLS